MNSLIRQLRAWRLREQLVRLSWGGARWFAIVAVVLGFACLADWLYDRRGEVPFALRVLASLSQVGLAAGLAYLFLIRPWSQTPPIDDLAVQHTRGYVVDHDFAGISCIGRQNHAS